MNAKRSDERSAADAWIERVLADREFARAEAARVARAREEALRENLPVLREVTESLRAVGYDVVLLSDLPVLEDGDPVIDVLVQWMKRLDNVDVKAGIARALTFRSVDLGLARTLVDEYESALPDSYLQWVIGNAIGAMVQPEILDDLIRLASVSEYGAARGQLIRALARFPGRKPVEAALIGLLSDESVIVEAIETAGRLELVEAVEPIRAWLDYDDEVVAETAREALARIARA